MKKLMTILITITIIFTMAVPAFADDGAVFALAYKPGKVQGVKVLKNGYRSLKITWKAVDGATKYQVYRSKTGKRGSFALKKTTTGTTYTNIGITCGKTYYYKVRAVNSKGKGAFSTAKSNKVQPAIVKITKVRPPRDMDNRVYWNKVTGATGYQVYRSKAGKNNWKLFKTVSNKYTYATDLLSGSDPNYNWQYKVRAYRTVNGKRVYGYFSTPAKWTPDWTIDQIYEESWKYVEAMKFPVCEVRDELNPEWDKYLWPKADGSTYSWKHVIGWNTADVWGYEAFVYTNPANGSTQKPAGYEAATPDNSNWGVLWPVAINPYMTHASIMKKIKGKLDVEMKDLSKANPLYWDSQMDDWSGADTFTIYYEKYGNGYKLWQLW